MSNPEPPPPAPANPDPPAPANPEPPVPVPVPVPVPAPGPDPAHPDPPAPGPTPGPTPGPITPVIPKEVGFHEVPASFGSWKLEDRVAFLKLQWFSKEITTCTLYDCYAQGAKVTYILKMFSFFVGKLKERVGVDAKEGEPTSQKLGRSFAKALNRAIVQLGRAINDNCDALMKTGKFPEKGPALPPVEVPDLFPEETGEEVEKTFKKVQDQSIGDVVIATLKVICNENKFLNHVYPMKGALSFMQLIMAAVKAGEDFYNEWVKDPSQLPLKDGKKEGELHKKAIAMDSGMSAMVVSNRMMSAMEITSLVPTLRTDQVANTKVSWVAEANVPVGVPSAFPDEADAE